MASQLVHLSCGDSTFIAGLEQAVRGSRHPVVLRSAGHLSGAPCWQRRFCRLLHCHSICHFGGISPHWHASCDYNCASCWGSPDGQGESHCHQVAVLC